MAKIVFNIDPYSFSTIGFIIGLLLVQDLSNDEQESIGNWLQLVGVVMQTFASQDALLHDNSNSYNNSSNDIECLKKTIKKMSEELDKLLK